MTSTGPGKGRRFINKEAVMSVIGPSEETRKQVVVMSAKDLAESQHDVFTSVPKKVILKDFLTVMKRDQRLCNKPLHYLLQTTS
jgi:hypothetical protein